VRTAAIAAVLFVAAAHAQTIDLSPLSDGAMKKMGGYRPQHLKLAAEKPATITKAPPGLEAPLYGVLAMGPDAGAKGAPVYHVIVDEPEGKDARLFVDANGNGDLTDDPPCEWTTKSYRAEDKDYTQYNGGATIELRAGSARFPAHLGMYRFDKADPGRGGLKDVILYYADYAREGDVTLGGKKFHALLTDDLATGDFRGKAIKDPESKDDDTSDASSGVRLLLDVNGNGKFDARGESYDVRRPFNIGGTTYEITGMSPLGASFKVTKSSKKVAEVPTPPDHAVGKKATAFNAETTENKKVSFPSSYKGKIVMLDFWATWCGPCMEEVPGLVKVYKEFHPSGFEVLGVTLDQKNSLDKVIKVTGEQGMTWPQIYDGGYWKAELAELYVIRSIPAAFLVDGDSGEILASGMSLRGDALHGTIEEALKKKAKSGGN
jgi:thiol-disulfide isomerase/thioredoxin